MPIQRPLPLASLALACGLWFIGPSLPAQEHGAPAQQEAQHSETTHSPEAAPAHAAAGHETPTAGHGEAAHHGPEIKLFGMTLGPFGQFLVKLFNFSVFFFGLFFLLKGALGAAFKARTKELLDQLSQAERDKAQGEVQIKELDAKMAGLQQELDGIMVKANADAEAEKERLLEAARQEADQIMIQTRQEIEHQKRMAEQELRALVAELAIEGASTRLKARVQGATAEQVMDRSIQQVGGAQ